MAAEQNEKQTYYRKYFYRLFFYFSSILLIMFAAMIAVYGFASRDSRNNLKEKIQANLAVSAQMIDAHMQAIQNVGLNLFNAEVMRFYFKYNASENQEIWAEQYRIVNLIAQNEGVFGGQLSMLYVFYLDSDKVYTSAGVYGREFFFREICSYQEDTPEYFNIGETDAIQVLPSGMTKVRYAEAEMMIPVVTTKRIDGHGAAVVANLSAKQILSMLEGATLTDDTEFLILDQFGNAVLNTFGDAARLEQLLSLSALEAGVEYDNYLVFPYHSPDSSWLYLSLVPKKGIEALTNANMVYVLLIGAGLTMLALGLALIYSLRIYKPINSLVKELLTLDEESCPYDGDDMKLLQSGVSALIHKDLKYQERFCEYAEKYVDHALHLAINGIPNVDTEQMKENLKSYYGFHSEEYCCICVFFDFSLKFFEELEEEKRTYIYRNLRIVLKALIEHRVSCCCLEGQGGIYPCILNTSSIACMDQICMDLKRIFEHDIQYYMVSIGIGDSFLSISNVKKSYEQAVRAMHYLSGTDTFKVFKYSDIPDKKQVAFSFYDQKKIVNSIKLSKKPQLEQVLNEVLDINNTRGISGRNQMELYRQLFSIGQRCLEDCDNSKGELESENRLRLELWQQEEQLDQRQLRKSILEYFDEIYELANTKEIQTGNQQMEIIKKYVQENYMGNLSLDSMAEVLGISPKYLSRLFKQKTGTNLTEYVNVVRVDKAKELLLKTNLKIGEIYSMVGMDSRQTFMRVFKKYEGYSPSEYRTMLLEEEAVKEEQA